MTDDEIKIVIAEACGWTDIRISKYSEGDRLWGRHLNSCIRLPLPDYSEDLNAIHEAEKSIPNEKFEDYWNNLLTICIPTAKHQRHWSEDVGWLCTTDATARQRCEAFIKTVCPEKWKE